MTGHKQRAHSKFSASGSERWLNCAASVELEEKSPPSKDSVWSIEGTIAHEVLEVLFKIYMLDAFKHLRPITRWKNSPPMVEHAMKMIKLVFNIQKTLIDPELLVEQRIYNNEIHPEMFGTVDAALVELFGTLHVFDYKFGQGHVVDPVENTQMIQYALGLAEKYDWNFEKVTVHICQPRAPGKWHKEWTISIERLLEYRELWRKGVARVEKGGNKPFEGSWCHWCRAKDLCEAKQGKRVERIANMFDELSPLERTETNGLKKESGKKGRKESSKKEGYKKDFGKFVEDYGLKESKHWLED